MIGIEDLSRLAIEIRESDVTVEQWADRNGFTKELIIELTESLLSEFAELVSAEVTKNLVEKAKEHMESGDDSITEVAPGVFLGVGNLGDAVDMGKMLKFALWSAFTLGWEAKSQLSAQGPTLSFDFP